MPPSSSSSSSWSSSLSAAAVDEFRSQGRQAPSGAPEKAKRTLTRTVSSPAADAAMKTGFNDDRQCQHSTSAPSSRIRTPPHLLLLLLLLLHFSLKRCKSSIAAYGLK
ncbi:hypothetical protein Q1695_009405 [Nippostrongylus brasiliensis]|nr:hypothetical protein Q1695_009405 [Nippostrongylus brasiliensis]